MTGYSVNWIQEIARRYREDGPAGIGDRRHANPGAAPLLDAAQQAQLRPALAGPAPDGGIWTCRRVAAWMSADAGAAGQRAARLGVDAPPRLHPAAPASRARPGPIRPPRTAFKKGGLPPPSPP